MRNTLYKRHIADFEYQMIKQLTSTADYLCVTQINDGSELKNRKEHILRCLTGVQFT